MSGINKQARDERKEKLRIRYVAVKNSDIVKNMAADDLKAAVKSPRMTEYLNNISSGNIKTARSRNYKPQSACGQLYDPYDISFTNCFNVCMKSSRTRTPQISLKMSLNQSAL